jgi:hypothetical protein
MNNQEVAIFFIEGDKKNMKSLFSEEIKLYSQAYDEEGKWINKELSLINVLIETYTNELKLKINISEKFTPFERIMWLLDLNNLVTLHSNAIKNYPEEFYFLNRYMRSIFGDNIDENNLREQGFKEHEYISKFINIIAENFHKQYNEEANIYMKKKKILNF